MQNTDARRAKKILLAQCVTTVFVAFAGWVHSPAAALSAGIGGSIATAANALFAIWVFGRYRAQEPGKLVASFYGGELLKLAFVAGAFAATMILMENLAPVALFGAYLVVQVLPVLLVNRFAG